MGFTDTGPLGVPLRPRVYSDKLPKNVSQDLTEVRPLFRSTAAASRPEPCFAFF